MIENGRFEFDSVKHQCVIVIISDWFLNYFLENENNWRKCINNNILMTESNVFKNNYEIKLNTNSYAILKAFYW